MELVSYNISEAEFYFRLQVEDGGRCQKVYLLGFLLFELVSDLDLDL
jgi:hypothetical protein